MLYHIFIILLLSSFLLLFFKILLLSSNLSELSDRTVDPQRVGRDHRYVVGRVPELSQRRARLMVHVTAVAGAHGHAAGGLGLRALPYDARAGRRGQEHGRRRRQGVRGPDAAATAAATTIAAVAATGDAGRVRADATDAT